MESDRTFMLVLLIVIIAGFYWFQSKLDSQHNKRKRVTFSKEKRRKRKSIEDSSDIINTDSNTESNIESIGNISVDSVSMGSLSFASSEGEETMGSMSSSDILSNIDDSEEEDDN